MDPHCRQAVSARESAVREAVLSKAEAAEHAEALSVLVKEHELSVARVSELVARVQSLEEGLEEGRKAVGECDESMRLER